MALFSENGKSQVTSRSSPPLIMLELAINRPTYQEAVQTGWLKILITGKADQPPFVILQSSQ